MKTSDTTPEFTPAGQERIFLRNFRELNYFGKAELILRAGLDPKIARRAREGECAQTFIQPLMESG
jgi:hypothetical protein